MSGGWRLVGVGNLEPQGYGCAGMNAALWMTLGLSVAVAQPEVRVVGDRVGGRKIANRSLHFDVERYVLPNGLTVLLSHDPTAQSASVNMGFRAGTLYEPRDRAGMAHLVEHVMLRGRTPDTDYVALLEAHGVVFLNAFTSSHFISFEVEVVPSAVPLALWVHCDRLATLPGKLDPADLDRHKSVVDVERIQRTVDVPFGGVEMAIHRQMFPRPHPMHSAVIGRPDELARVTLAEVQAFARRYLVPSNGVLTVVGRFDVAEVKAQIADTLGQLPPGRRARHPRNSQLEGKPAVYRVRERRARQPRVTVLWRVEGLGERSSDALTLGGWLLSNYVDGAFGTQVRANLTPVPGASYFRLDVTLPYDKPVDAATAEAEVFLRYLTAVDMPRDFLNATRLAIDRYFLFTMDTVRGRATMMAQMELADDDPTHPEGVSRRLWALDRQTIRHVAWTHLVQGNRRLVVHARPVRPRRPKLNWDER